MCEVFDFSFFSDPNFDPVAAAKQDRKARSLKNESQRLRNLQRAASNAATQASEKEKRSSARDQKKVELDRALKTTKKSTASVGKFDDKLKGETKEKNVKRKVSLISVAFRSMILKLNSSFRCTVRCQRSFSFFRTFKIPFYSHCYRRHSFKQTNSSFRRCTKRSTRNQGTRQRQESDQEPHWRPWCHKSTGQARWKRWKRWTRWKEVEDSHCILGCIIVSFPCYLPLLYLLLIYNFESFSLLLCEIRRQVAHFSHRLSLLYSRANLPTQDCNLFVDCRSFIAIRHQRRRFRSADRCARPLSGRLEPRFYSSYDFAAPRNQEFAHSLTLSARSSISTNCDRMSHSDSSLEAIKPAPPRGLPAIRHHSNEPDFTHPDTQSAGGHSEAKEFFSYAEQLYRIVEKRAENAGSWIRALKSFVDEHQTDNVDWKKAFANITTVGDRIAKGEYLVSFANSCLFFSVSVSLSLQNLHLSD